MNTIERVGFEVDWIKSPSDLECVEVSQPPPPSRAFRALGGPRVNKRDKNNESYSPELGNLDTASRRCKPLATPNR